MRATAVLLEADPRLVRRAQRGRDIAIGLAKLDQQVFDFPLCASGAPGRSASRQSDIAGNGW